MKGVYMKMKIEVDLEDYVRCKLLQFLTTNNENENQDILEPMVKWIVKLVEDN